MTVADFVELAGFAGATAWLKMDGNAPPTGGP
jgi:hypothetical protein